MLTMPQLQQSLNDEAARLEALAKEIRLLMGGSGALETPGRNSDGPAMRPRSNQYRGKPVTQAIEEYLETKGQPATKEELLEVLVEGGAELGKFPKRTVSTSVGFGVKKKRLEQKDGKDGPVSLPRWQSTSGG